MLVNLDSTFMLVMANQKINLSKAYFKYAKKKHVFVQKPTPPPRTKDTYYNMPPSSEQNNDVELQTEQRNVKPKRPTCSYV